MLGEILAGTAVVVAMLVSFALAAAAACGGYAQGCTRNELAVDIALLATALAMFVPSLLLVAGAANLASVAGSAVALGGLALAWRGRAALGRLRDCARGAFGVLAHSAFAWLLAAVGLLSLARALALPQLAWDGLTYHLTYPAVWLQYGGAVRFDAGGVWEVYESFPKAGEALFYLALLPFGRDYLVNAVNLLPWFGLALSLRACAQRLGLRRWLQDGCAALVALCPAFAGYITPAYVEVPTAFAFSAGLCAALRVLRAGDSRALVPMYLALGVAIATKVTGLTFAPFALLCSLLCARRDPRAALRGSALGLLAAAAVAAPWYLHNLASCGNPLYPLALPGFGAGAAAGSLPLRFSLEQTSIVAQDALGRVAESLATPPWRSGRPLGPIGVYYWALLLPVLALPWCARAARRTAALLLALALCLLASYLVTPWNGLYAIANTRFLGPSFIAAALACAVAIEALPRAAGLCASWVSLLLTLAYLRRLPALADVPWAAPSLWLALSAGCALAAGAAAQRAAERHARSYRGLRAVAAGCALLALGLLPASLGFRERHRLDSYARAVDLHPVPSSALELAPLIERLPASRIAFASGGVDFTEGWFFYPLFGSDLRHHVGYVDVQADGARRACERRGLIRERPDFDAWQRRLSEARVEFLLLRGEPLEAQWAAAHPERFAKLRAFDHHTLFRVLR